MVVTQALEWKKTDFLAIQKCKVLGKTLGMSAFMKVGGGEADDSVFQLIHEKKICNQDTECLALGQESSEVDYGWACTRDPMRLEIVGRVLGRFNYFLHLCTLILSLQLVCLCVKSENRVANSKCLQIHLSHQGGCSWLCINN